MDKFFHIRMLMSMITSLALAHLLKGVAKILEHPKRVKIYWVHLLWVFYMFILLIDFWWWEFNLKSVTEWNFEYYFFIIIFIILFFITCYMLFPDDMKEHEGFKEYYYARKNWIFALLATIFLMDVGDTLIKGNEYMEKLGPEYSIRIGVHVTLCLAAIGIKKEWFHAALAVAFTVYGISWIVRRSMIS